MAELLNILKRKNEYQNGGSDFDSDKSDNDLKNKKEFFIISSNWVSFAIPFIEEFTNENTDINEDEFFNLNKIFNKCMALYEKKKINNSNYAYPFRINNTDIIEYKDYWHDYDKSSRNTNVFLMKNARENENYFFLSKKNWSLLENIFGCVNEIPRYSLKEETDKIENNLLKVRKI